MAEVKQQHLIDAGAVPLFVRCLGEVERGDIVLRTAGAALIRLIRSSVSGRAAVVDLTPQLLTQLKKDGGGAEQIALVLAASGGLNEAKFAAGAAKSIGKALVRLSKSSSVEVRDSATGLLIALAQSKHEVPALLDAGAADCYVERVSDGSGGHAQRAAAAALRALTSQPGAGGVKEVVRAGALRPLLKLLRAGDLPASLEAAHVVNNLASNVSTRQTVSEEVGAIAACVLTVQRSSGQSAAELAELAASSLACISDAGHLRRQEIVAAAGVAALVGLLQRHLFAQHPLESAARALYSLCEDVGSHAALVSSGGIAPLVALAATGDAASRHTAATLHLLAAGGDRNALGALGASTAAVEWFVSKLQGGLRDGQYAALCSIRHLCAQEARYPPAPTRGERRVSDARTLRIRSLHASPHSLATTFCSLIFLPDTHTPTPITVKPVPTPDTVPSAALAGGAASACPVRRSSGTLPNGHHAAHRSARQGGGHARAGAARHQSGTHRGADGECHVSAD